MTHVAISFILLCTLQAREKHECTQGGHEEGMAVDFGGFNGKDVSLYPKDKEIVRALKATFESFHKKGEDPPCEYYAPDGLYRNGKRFFDKKLQAEHRDHVHVRFCK